MVKKPLFAAFCCPFRCRGLSRSGVLRGLAKERPPRGTENAARGDPVMGPTAGITLDVNPPENTMELPSGYVKIAIEYDHS